MLATEQGAGSASRPLSLRHHLHPPPPPPALPTHAGREVREQMLDQVTELLHDLDEGMLPITVMFPYLPIPAHFRRDK